MARVLIAYSTSEGQSAKIAQHIADAGRKLGHVVNARIFDFTCPRNDCLVWRSTAEEYAGVVLGASLYKGRYPRDIAALVRRQSAWLNAHPSAFFSVSLGTVGSDAYEIAEVERVMDDFLEQNGWQPDRTASFSGLKYTQSNWWKRALLQYTSWEEDAPSDYEYTDWSSVTAFAKRFFADVARSTETSVPLSSASERGVPGRSRAALRA